MDFGLSDAQNLLQSSVRDLLAQEVPIERLRSIMDSEEGFDRSIHAALGDQGVAGLMVAEEHGGSELGLLDTALAAQELGRAATPVSFHSSSVMAPLLIQALGSDDQRAAWLTGIASGEAVISVALCDLDLSGHEATGTVAFAPDAQHADAFLLASPNGAAIMARGVEGLETAPLRTVDDTRRVGELRLEGVSIADTKLASGDLATAVQRTEQAGRVALAADALGAAQEGLRIAVEYAKQREQFERVIASFQAVKHMCADTIAEVDPVQSLLWYAAYAWDTGLDEVAHLVPLLKAHATETATQATTTCTKVFGGIGFTHECDMHIFYKRAGYDRQMLGGPLELRREAADAQYPIAS